MSQENKEVQEVQEVQVKTRGRPRLTDEQRLQRDRERYEKQHAYYIANKDRIGAHQKEVKNKKYSEDPEFRNKALEYIKAYNKRRTAIVSFVSEWKDPAFHQALGKYLVDNL